MTDVEQHNKPMVATAHTQRAEYALSSGRRHIGQPLGAGDRAGLANLRPVTIGNAQRIKAHEEAANGPI